MDSAFIEMALGYIITSREPNRSESAMKNVAKTGEIVPLGVLPLQLSKRL